MKTAPLICIDRHRLTIDGEGGVPRLWHSTVVRFVANTVSIPNALMLTAYGRRWIQNC